MDKWNIVLLVIFVAAVGDARPSTSVSVFRPVTNVSVSKAMSTHTVVFRPTTSVPTQKPTGDTPLFHPISDPKGRSSGIPAQAIFHPQTNVTVQSPITTQTVFHPTTHVEVFHPTTTVGEMALPSDSHEGGTSRKAPTTMGGKVLPEAKNFKQEKASSFTPNVGGLVQTPDVSADNATINAIRATGEKFSAADSADEFKRKALSEGPNVSNVNSSFIKDIAIKQMDK